MAAADRRWPSRPRLRARGRGAGTSASPCRRSRAGPGRSRGTRRSRISMPGSKRSRRARWWPGRGRKSAGPSFSTVTAGCTSNASGPRSARPRPASSGWRGPPVPSRPASMPRSIASFRSPPFRTTGRARRPAPRFAIAFASCREGPAPARPRRWPPSSRFSSSLAWPTPPGSRSPPRPERRRPVSRRRCSRRCGRNARGARPWWPRSRGWKPSGRGEHGPPAPRPRGRGAAPGGRPHPRRGVDGGPHPHGAGACRPARQRPSRAPRRRLAARLRPTRLGVRRYLPGGARGGAARFRA